MFQGVVCLIYPFYRFARDIKPENVVLLDRPSPDGYIPFAKLLDFGLSKMIGTAEGSAATTFVGTPCYLAP